MTKLIDDEFNDDNDDKCNDDGNDEGVIDNDYLTTIPRARMGSQSIAHEAEGRIGYWLRGHESERNKCFNKIQLAGQKISRQNIFC